MPAFKLNDGRKQGTLGGEPTKPGYDYRDGVTGPMPKGVDNAMTKKFPGGKPAQDMGAFRCESNPLIKTFPKVATKGTVYK